MAGSVRTARRRWLLPAAVALVLLGGLVVVLLPRGAASTLGSAVERLPGDTLRVSYVDWAQLRAATGDPGADASTAQVEQFLRRSSELDAAPLTALGDEIEVYQQLYGISVLEAQWEALGQSRAGQVDVLAVDDDLDLDVVEQKLTDLGYRAPAGGPGSGGVWIGGSDLVRSLDSRLTPIVQAVAVRPDERLVMFSDSEVYLATAVDVIDGDAESLGATTHVPALVEAAGTATVGALLAQDFACEALSMLTASEEGRQGLEVASAGATPLEGYWFGRTGRDLTIAMAFDDAATAESNLAVRAELASGRGYGQGGRLPDRFVLDAAETRDDLVVLEATVRPRTRLMNTFVEGPVGFATCG